MYKTHRFLPHFAMAQADGRGVGFAMLGALALGSDRAAAKKNVVFFWVDFNGIWLDSNGI